MSKTARVDDKAEMRKAWEGIFASDIYFHYPFQPQIECCLLYPYTDGGRLSEDQYRAVTEAARAGGARGFYYSETELSNSFDRPDHWWCEFPTYEEYHGLNMHMLETATYAKDSSWGVGVSHEWHAVVGGSEDFIRRVDEGWREWRKDVIKLIDDWEKDAKDRGAGVINVTVHMLEYWKKYPGDEWVATVTANIERQIQRYWKSRPDPVGAEWTVWLAEKMNLKLEE